MILLKTAQTVFEPRQRDVAKASNEQEADTFMELIFHHSVETSVCLQGAAKNLFV